MISYTLGGVDLQVIGGLGTILEMSCDQSKGSEPRCCTKEV